MSTSASARRLIMLVEDDAEIRDALSELLLYEGYQVVTAVNGKEGLDLLLGGHKPSVILLDVRMPVMNGYEFLQKMRMNPGWAGIPVIVLSAHVDEGQIQGALSFFRKPIDVDQLLPALSELLS